MMSDLYSQIVLTRKAEQTEMKKVTHPFRYLSHDSNCAFNGYKNEYNSYLPILQVKHKLFAS